MVHPAPLMKGLLSEDTACEDLASVLNMVSLFWVWLAVGGCVAGCFSSCAQHGERALGVC